MKLFVAGFAALAVFGGGIGSASAATYSLGPAGTAVAATGYLGGAVPGFEFGYSTSIGCTTTKLSGTLNGGSSVSLRAVFSGCSGTNWLRGPATVSAPGGLQLSAVGRTWGQLTSGSGITVTSGACTLTVPANVPLVTSGNPTRLKLENKTEGTFVDLPFTAGNELNPWSGTAGCPERLRGSHTSGFGAENFLLGTFAGMHVS